MYGTSVPKDSQYLTLEDLLDILAPAPTGIDSGSYRRMSCEDIADMSDEELKAELIAAALRDRIIAMNFDRIGFRSPRRNPWFNKRREAALRDELARRRNRPRQEPAPVTALTWERRRRSG